LLLRRHWSVLHLQVPTCFGSRCETDWLTYLGGGLFGFDISSMSGVLGTEAYKRYFNHPRSYGQGAITAAMPFGSLVGALSSSFIADRYSRRTAIQIASIIWIIGSM
jgi:MFS family permease